MDIMHRAQSAIASLREPAAPFARVPNTIRQSLADIIEGLQSQASDLLWRLAQKSEAQRTADMPTEQDAINRMNSAHQRLRELGWNDGISSPKDGSTFQIIENGSTGIFDCYYSGKWPDGYWNTMDGHDVYPSRRPPVLWRAKSVTLA